MAFLLLLGLAVGAAAQASPKKKPRAARAVALLEWHKDAKGALAPRLLPISFLWEEKYYDAGIYEASPRPLALEPGTVYEAMRSGVPAGLFTVVGAADVKGVWYGDGIWSPGATGASRSAASGDEERPRLKRAAPGGAPPAANVPPGTKAEPEPVPNDPDRPTLHRGKPAEASTGESPVPTKPGAKPATRSGEPPAPATSEAKPAARSGEAPVPAKPSDHPEPLVAVSDEKTTDPRPYLFQWNRDEEENLTAQVAALAQAEVAREAGEKLDLEQVHVRAFDLYYSNLPEIVLSARTPGAKSAAPGKKVAKGLKGQPRIYYVTVVARVTVSGEMRKLFASVTSSAWLGSVPRMEVVDAVDADGDGNGDLLFSEITTGGHSYALYRVGRDELFPLVKSGPLPND